MESEGAQAVASSTALRSRIALGDDGRPIDGVMRADLSPDSKHGDGSIYRRTDAWSKLYRLDDTNETCLEPMMMSKPLTSCSPNWRACETHKYCTMMQIFSLKLAYLSSSVGGPVQLYGYLAVRDSLNPLRNYVFNRTRDDPFIVEQDGFIQMSGPKRGIKMHAMVLIEFDMTIKRGEKEGDDIQLIDGAVGFNDLTSSHARVNMKRIDGDCGSVDISFALLNFAAEATVQVGISELEHGSGLSLCATAFYISDLSPEEIQLFDGVIPAAERYELNRYVVAVVRRSKLVVALKLSQTCGSDHRVLRRFCLSPAKKHGNDIFIFKLGFATIQVKISWSTLDIPQSLL